MLAKCADVTLLMRMTAKFMIMTDDQPLRNDYGDGKQ